MQEDQQPWQAVFMVEIWTLPSTLQLQFLCPPPTVTTILLTSGKSFTTTYSGDGAVVTTCHVPLVATSLGILVPWGLTAVNPPVPAPTFSLPSQSDSEILTPGLRPILGRGTENFWEIYSDVLHIPKCFCDAECLSCNHYYHTMGTVNTSGPP
jgi:hypothetical protein